MKPGLNLTLHLVIAILDREISAVCQIRWSGVWETSKLLNAV